MKTLFPRIVLWLTLCTPCFSAHGENEDMTVLASIPPQEYFIQKIAGDTWTVQSLVRPGKSPETYEPTPQQMVQVSRAHLYFAIGVPFEATWLERFVNLNPDLKIIRTDEGVDKIPLHHKHLSRKKHPQNFDPHIWLDPGRVLIQAKNILNAFIKFDPENKNIYKKNFGELSNNIIDLDIEIRKSYKLVKTPFTFLVHHPSWGYFADSYNLIQLSIEKNGKNPKAQELAGLIKTAKKHSIKTVFASPHVSTKPADIIAKSIGGKVVLIDPLAADWYENIREVAARILLSSMEATDAE